MTNKTNPFIIKYSFIPCSLRKLHKKTVWELIVSHRLPALACLSVSKRIATHTLANIITHIEIDFAYGCGAIVIIFTDYKFARFVDENDSITPYYVCSCFQEQCKYNEQFVKEANNFTKKIFKCNIFFCTIC